jgi:hypothetical protein
MWAGRLRQNGAAFAALGPARAAAALKGKGPAKGRGKAAAAKVASAPASAGGPSAHPLVGAAPAPAGVLAVQAAGRTRADFPLERGVKRASKEKAVEAAATADSRAEALLALRRDMTAASGKGNADSLWATWSLFHEQWFGPELATLPLTADKIMAVAACFKCGGYRAFPGYMSKAKEKHILAGCVWDGQLDLVSRKATTSVTRGLGMARQSTPFKLLMALQAVKDNKVVLPDAAPIGWCSFMVIATFFVMREIEAANLRVEHTTINDNELSVQLLLPVSKKDPRAVGCSRAWKCLCKGGAAAGATRMDCPYHAATEQLARLRERFGVPLPADLPLFPTEDGQPVARAAVIAALEATVQAYGDPIAQPNGSRLLGGHSFRVTGAQQLAALGVDVIKIMVLARWAGESVLRYVRDAPLDNLPDEVRALEEKRSLLEALDKLQADVRDINDKVDGQAEEAARITGELRMYAPTIQKPFIANGNHRRFKLHWAAIDGSEVIPQLWKTRCGVKFGNWSFTRHESKVEFPIDTWCTKCFGAQQVEAPKSSSSEGKDSSESESE